MPEEGKQFSRRAMHEAVFEAGWQLSELMNGEPSAQESYRYIEQVKESLLELALSEESPRFSQLAVESLDKNNAITMPHFKIVP